MLRQKKANRLFARLAAKIGACLIAGFAANHVYAAQPTSLQVAQTRKQIQDWVQGPASQDWRAARIKLAKKIKSDSYEYLISHDASVELRTEAMSNFGDLVSPQETLPTFIRLAKTDPDSSVRFMAIVMIYLNYAGGLLRGRDKAVEQLAVDCINRPHQRLFAIKILGYCRTTRGDKILREVLSSNSTKYEKRDAASGLAGKFHIGDHRN